MSFAERCYDVFLPLIMAGAVSAGFYLALTCVMEVGFAKSLRQKFYVMAVMVVCIGFTAICGYYGFKVPLVLLFVSIIGTEAMKQISSVKGGAYNERRQLY